MSNILEILRPFGRPSPEEEATLDMILEKLGRGDLTADEAIEAIMDRLDWPLERAAAEVDGYLD